MHFILQELWLTFVSGPCLFLNALLCPDLWATAYTAAAVFVFLFSFSFFFPKGNAKLLSFALPLA